MVRVDTKASLLQILRHLMNHDAAHVVGRDWVLTVSYGAYEVLSKIELEDSVLPYIPDPDNALHPPIPMGHIDLIACAALTFEHEEVEFCRIGQNDYDLIIYLDSGHSVATHTSDAVIEKLIREQSERVQHYKHWWTD